MSKYILKLISPSGSHTILVFPCQTVWQFSDGAWNAGGMSNRDFQPISRFMSEMIQDRAVVSIEC